MVTRRQARRWLCWTGVGIGAAAAALIIFSLLGEIEWTTKTNTVTIRNAAIVSFWGNTSVPRTPGLMVNKGYGWWFAIVPLYDRAYELVLPLWIPLVVGLYAGYRLLPESGKKGHCPNCAHDLSGAPPVEIRKEYVRCPECGILSERDAAAGRPVTADSSAT